MAGRFFNSQTLILIGCSLFVFYRGSPEDHGRGSGDL